MGSLFFSTVEGVGHRKLIAIMRVGHGKICRNFFGYILMFRAHIGLGLEKGLDLG